MGLGAPKTAADRRIFQESGARGKNNFRDF
jgi:hypothetical protein